MKKTIALLLAMAGMAMASTESVQLNWQNNQTATFETTSGFSNGITIAVLFDWNKITKTDFGEGTFLFTLDGSRLGLGADTYKGNEIGLWYTDPEMGSSYAYPQLNYQLQTLTSYENVSYATVVFSVWENEDGYCGLREDIYLWDNAGTQVNKDNVASSVGNTKKNNMNYAWDSSSFKGLTLNTGVITNDRVLAYSGITSSDAELLAIAQSVLPGSSMPDSPAAPEPTTATLSLLALAGLAARRRRK